MGLFQLPELEERNVRQKMSIIRMILEEAAIITSLARNLEISYGFGPLVLMMIDELVWLLMSNEVNLRLTLV